ncbi:hypothetical protein OAA84_07000 [Amylibacter sp.]|nr:hypothetical protein [Amylibacter sp.]
MLTWEDFFKSSDLNIVSNENDAISTMNNLNLIFENIFLALGTSIALVTSWIIFLPISRPLLKIPKFLFQITIIEPIKAIFGLPDEISSLKEDKEKRKAGSSKIAKAGLLMGAVALARSSKPSKVPQAVARNGDVKNIDCHHKGKNKWIVTYETLHPSSGWISGKNEINPSISGFSTIGGTIDITWH